MKTILDTSEKMLNYIQKNELDKIWAAYSTPKSIDGIRLNAYTPLYATGIEEFLQKRCNRVGKDKVPCGGTWRIPQDDMERGVAVTLKCDNSKCRRYKTLMYRWVKAGDKRKLHFDCPETVDYYTAQGRAFYATLTVHDKSIITPGVQYINEKLIKGCSLGIDIDIISGTILNSENKSDLQKTVKLVKDELSPVCQNNFNIHTSGNGIQMIACHNLCRVNVFETMAKFNGFIIHLDAIRAEKGITKTKIDPLNTAGRLFKLIGSPHQRWDLSCIPVDWDANIEKIPNEEFKLENFDINKYRDADGKLIWYNRCDLNETKSLYEFLYEHSTEHPEWGERALRYKFKEGIEAITGEEQHLTEEEQKKHQSELDERVEHVFGWQKFETETPGRVHYKDVGSKYRLQIYANEEDKKKIIEKFEKMMVKRKQ